MDIKTHPGSYKAQCGEQLNNATLNWE